jgi:peptidyl-Lys metalloendopeptidase
VAGLLTYRLQAQKKYDHSLPIKLGFSIENLSVNDLWILKWYTPLEGIKSNIFEIVCDGVEIPYEGRMIKRGEPERDDYLRLRARSTEHVEVDLSGAYHPPSAKECRVQFKGRIHDVVSDASQVPRAIADHRPIDIDGDAVVFEVR